MRFNVHLDAEVNDMCVMLLGLNVPVRLDFTAFGGAGTVLGASSAPGKWDQISHQSDFNASRFHTPHTQLLRGVIGFCGSALELGG